MGRITIRLTWALVVVMASIVAGALFSLNGAPEAGEPETAPGEANNIQLAPPTYIREPARNVILASVTPQPSATNTLLPPPTFEPPTATPTPSPEPSVTPTAAIQVDVMIPGLHCAETPTPTSTPGCEPRADWKLTYTVQFDDTLSSIADM